MDAVAAESPKPAARTVPELRGRKIFGHLREIRDSPIESLRALHDAHGDVIRLRLPGFWLLSIRDADLLHEMLVKKHASFGKRTRPWMKLRSFLRDGLLTSDGDEWRTRRRIAQPAFRDKNLEPLTDAISASTAAALDEWSTREGLFDVSREISSLTMLIAGKLLLGTEIRDDDGEIGESVTEVLRQVMVRARRPVDFVEYLPLPQNFRFLRNRKRFDTLAGEIIERRRIELDKGDAPQDLLTLLMEARDPEGEARYTDGQLLEEVKTLFVAGHETTANALSWTLYLLSKHPEIQETLFEEAKRVLGERPFGDATERAKLVETDHVLRESMRHYPPAWGFGRSVREPCTLGDIALEPGELVYVSTSSLHRHPKYWEKPDDFYPEHFRDEAVANRPRLAYLPFGAGPRICIGASFAMTEMLIVLPAILRRFRIEPSGDPPPELEPLVTLRPKGGLRLRLVRR